MIGVFSRISSRSMIEPDVISPLISPNPETWSARNSCTVTLVRFSRLDETRSPRSERPDSIRAGISISSSPRSLRPTRLLLTRSEIFTSPVLIKFCILREFVIRLLTFKRPAFASSSRRATPEFRSSTREKELVARFVYEIRPF